MPAPDTLSIHRTIEHSDAMQLVGKPLVSVLVLAYNHAAFLPKAVESAVTQEVDFEFEVLVGEDCSKDDSLQVALTLQQRFPSLVRVITADNNVGAYRNYLRLLRAARGIVQRDFTTTPFIVAACFYLVMTLVLTWGFQYLEKRYAKYDA